jgi:regulator of ribonuclease activity A
MLRSATSTSIPFTTTAEIYDQHGDACCRIPHVQWRSYGGLTSFSGTAVTVDCRELSPPDNSVVRQALSQNGQGTKVLVVDAGGSTRHAFLGDQLAALAQQNNWNGIVVHGCVRDSQELKELPMGIVAIGTTPRKTDKQGKGGKLDVRVRIGDADCYPGDYVFCDSDGVIFMNPPNLFKG